MQRAAAGPSRRVRPVQHQPHQSPAFCARDARLDPVRPRYHRGTTRSCGVVTTKPRRGHIRGCGPAHAIACRAVGAARGGHQPSPTNEATNASNVAPPRWLRCGGTSGHELARSVQGTDLSAAPRADRSDLAHCAVDVHHGNWIHPSGVVPWPHGPWPKGRVAAVA